MVKKNIPLRRNSTKVINDILSNEGTIKQSDERYRTIIENIHDGYFEIDLAGNLNFFNDAVCKIYGRSREEMLGTNNQQYSNKDNSKKVFKAFNEIYKTGKAGSIFDYEIVRKDKTKRQIEVNASLIKDSSENPIGFRGILRDVTERKQMEETLRQSEERYRTILDETDGAYFEVDIAGNFTFLNDALCRHLGYAREELIGKSSLGQIAKEDVEKVYKAYNKIYKTGKHERGIYYKLIRKDGTARFVEAAGFPLLNKKGEIIGFRGVGRDITERKQMEENIRQSEQRYRNILEGIQEAYFEIDLKGSLTFLNRALYEYLGYGKEELLGKNNRLYTDQDTQNKMFEAFNNLYQTGLPIKAIEEKIIKKDGTTGVAELSVSLIRDAAGNPIGFAGISRDISERKEMEETIRQSEERYRTIIEEMDEWYFETDLNGNLHFSNDAIARILGHSADDVAGVNFKVVLNNEEESTYKLFRQICETGDSVQNIPRKFMHPDGSITFAEFSIFPKRDQNGNVIGFRGMGHDITEKKKIQIQLLQSEKMASIGQLAAGVAHEINNPIAFVSSNLKTLSEYLNDIVMILKLTRSLPEVIEKGSNIENHTLNERLEEIKKLEGEMKIDFIIDDLDGLIKESQEGTDRIIRIVRDLKTYAHPGDEKLKVADINENIESTLNIVWNEVKYKADVYKEYGNIPKIYCHPHELNQVFMNILVNAAQAIEEKGEIRIYTGVDSQDNIEIKIQDNGAGISEENLPKLFNPFFTTKDVGKGTGLGLHVAFSIIEKHQGKIEVESKVGVGTTFIIRLPIKNEHTQ